MLVTKAMLMEVSSGTLGALGEGNTWPIGLPTPAREIIEVGICWSLLAMIKLSV